MTLDRCIVGDCRDVMLELISHDFHAQCVVTSPPYFGLRDYGIANQIGLERNPMRYVARMRSVFRLVREVLTDDGVLWLNLGDSYYSPRIHGGRGGNSTRTQAAFRDAQRALRSQKQSAASMHALATNRRSGMLGIKPKDLIGIPWRVAFALQADGWYLRSDCIWHKPNPMPESVEDRPTKAHEYMFLLSKSERYYYDVDAVREPAETAARKGERRSYKPGSSSSMKDGQHQQMSGAFVGLPLNPAGRNKRSVWTVAATPFRDAHFATFPEKLIEPCVLAGSRPGDIVFDPFMGAGTVGAVASRLGRRWLGIEINPQYVEMQKSRTAQQGMPLPL